MNFNETTCSYLACSIEWSENFAGMAKLLRHVNGLLKGIWPVSVLSITIQEYIADQQYHPSLLITYFHQDTDEIARTSDLKVKYDEDKSWYPDIFKGDTTEDIRGPITITDIRLPKGSDQDNVPMLLDKVADYLDAHKINEPIAFSFDMQSDDDGIERPVFRIIFEN